MTSLKHEQVLGVSVTTSPVEEILKYVFDSVRSGTEKLKIFTPNPEIVMYAREHSDFLAILNQAHINLPDGVGMTMASLALGKERFSRMSGVDFMEMMCKESVIKLATVGFLGARGSIALEAAKCLQKKYPGLKVRFVGSEWENGRWIPTEYEENVALFEMTEKLEKDTLLPRIHLLPKQEIDILFVAFGFPKQETWISEHIDILPFHVGMGVGGAFDYLSGNVSRAPKPIQDVGLEWLYRLLRQPWRAKRQLALIRFIRLVISERFSSS